MTPSVPELVRSAPHFPGGGRSFRITAFLGTLGILTSLSLMLRWPEEGLSAYLVAFVFWSSALLGVLIWLASFHAARARWVVVFRRVPEVVTRPIATLLPLFLPIVIGARRLYLWGDPRRAATDEARVAILHKHAFLNVPFFAVRAALYFAAWALFAHLLFRWSTRQDTSGAIELSQRQRVLGSIALPILGLTMTFASIDWMMSLDAEMASTIFGFYFIAGSLAAGMALLILATIAADRAGLLGGLVRPAHYHSLGKLLFAFVCFWAYMAFSQYMLIWIGNLPDEIPWYLARKVHGWKVLSIALVLGHFAIPFLLLLPMRVKRTPRLLGAMAVWILAAHLVDIYWLVMPVVRPQGPRVGLGDLAAFVGIGGLLAALGLLRARGVTAIPIREPYLAESLRYDPP